MRQWRIEVRQTRDGVTVVDADDLQDRDAIVEGRVRGGKREGSERVEWFEPEYEIVGVEEIK